MAEYDSETIEVTRDYYNSEDADTFYSTVWGGEDLHLGIYKRPDESIFEASRRTVRRMGEKFMNLDGNARIIDLGGGYGGSMRHLVRTYGSNAVVINLSEKENERGRQMNQDQGLADRIDIIDGAFEDVPYEDNSFECAFSEDSILHSPDREKVLREAYRVLKPGGEFVFTDPMQMEDVPEGVLQPIYDRINLESLASPTFYWETAKKIGFEVSSYEDLRIHLPRHYQAVHDELERREAEVEKKISRQYIDNMKKGLKHWVDGGNKGYLTWGMFHLIKC